MSRLLLEELWNWYPLVDFFITILVLLMPIGGFYTVTSVKGSLCEPLKACLSAPSATTHTLVQLVLSDYIRLMLIYCASGVASHQH